MRARTISQLPEVDDVNSVDDSYMEMSVNEGSRYISKKIKYERIKSSVGNSAKS